MILKIISNKFKNTKFLISKFNFKKLNFTQSIIKKIFLNWLIFKIKKIYCLELFSGSGSLGIELSFKINFNLTLIEKNKFIYNYLNNFIKFYFNSNIKVINSCCLKYIYKINNFFYNFIIIDPPYRNLNIFFKIIKFLFYKNKKIYIYIESLIDFKILFFYFNFKFYLNKIIKFKEIYIYLIYIF